MARHTSLFSKVKGPVGELIFSSDTESPGSIARERNMLFSISPDDFTHQQWKVFYNSKIAGLLNSTNPYQANLNRMEGLLPSYQSLMKFLMRVSGIVEGTPPILSFNFEPTEKIKSNKSLHFPVTGNFFQQTTPDRDVLQYSTELGESGSTDDIVVLLVTDFIYPIIDNSGTIVAAPPWTYFKTGIRSDGEIEIEWDDYPPQHTPGTTAFIYLVSSEPVSNQDSSSLLLLKRQAGGSWDIPNP